MLTTPTFSQGLCKGSFHSTLAQGPLWFSNLDVGKDLAIPPLDLGFLWVLLALRGGWISRATCESMLQPSGPSPTETKDRAPVVTDPAWPRECQQASF